MKSGKILVKESYVTKFQYEQLSSVSTKTSLHGVYMNSDFRTFLGTTASYSQFTSTFCFLFGHLIDTHDFEIIQVVFLCLQPQFS